MMKWWNDEISLMNKFEKFTLFNFRDQNNITEENNYSGGLDLQRWADNFLWTPRTVQKTWFQFYNCQIINKSSKSSHYLNFGTKIILPKKQSVVAVITSKDEQITLFGLRERARTCFSEHSFLTQKWRGVSKTIILL